jgi:hypothetical protein
VQTFLETFCPKIDVLCMQEHRLCLGETKVIKHKICQDAELIFAPAVDGRRAMTNPDVVSGKGGLFLAVSPRYSQYISDKGILVSCAGVWCVFVHPHYGKFGIMGIYAPQHLTSKQHYGRSWPTLWITASRGSSLETLAWWNNRWIR